ncbi:hypothetical protein ACFQ3L_06620 [Lacticaseibacillus jixianensis]|uniref:Uncharacterized protein n=1 Tax=Lacticaseibacillus jixianensis TaxID=2486012 RepID=A0ABW4B917_9LACO|nr:hypothetical protein [Lacticaseibacillus jixianensis]
MLALFAKVVYTQHPRWLAAGFASLMLICGCLAGAALRWGPDWLSLTLPTPWGFAVIGGSLVLIIGGLMALGILLLRWLYNPGGLLIILLLGVALFRRYWLNTATSMTQHQAGWILLIFGGGYLIYIGWQLVSLKRLRRLKHHR